MNHMQSALIMKLLAEVVILAKRRRRKEIDPSKNAKAQKNIARRDMPGSSIVDFFARKIKTRNDVVFWSGAGLGVDGYNDEMAEKRRK